MIERGTLCGALKPSGSSNGQRSCNIQHLKRGMADSLEQVTTMN
jgi:hypothetical protein